MTSIEEAIHAVAQKLRGVERTVVLTGAGVSQESGVPTFRDALTGLWATFNPQELATREAFQRNPKMVWDWYEYRRAMLKQVEPNAGHRAIAAMEAIIPRVTVVTQNIDGLHRRAGSTDIIELHGNIQRHSRSAPRPGAIPRIV